MSKFKAVFEESEAERLVGPNKVWAESHLPIVRMALRMLTLDETELERPTVELLKEGTPMDELLKEMRRTRDHLRELVWILNTALARQSSILERLGHGPTDVPPTEMVH
jgi:hypothetical protein